MATAGLRLTPRQRNIDRAHFVYGEALSDCLDAAEAGEQACQSVLGDTEDLEIEVLRRVTQQAIANEPADDERAAAVAANGIGDVACERQDRGLGSHAPAMVPSWAVEDGR